MKKSLKEFLMIFFIVNTCVLIAAATYISLLEKNAVLDVSILWQILGVTFVTTLSDVVYYSKKELSRKQIIIRTCIQYIWINIIVISSAYIFSWIDTTKPFYYVAALMVLIAIVYIIIKLICYKKDAKMAEKFNERIAEYNKSKC